MLSISTSLTKWILVIRQVAGSNFLIYDLPTELTMM